MPDQADGQKSLKEKRAERSAAALRANLRRRKEQQHQRSEDSPPEATSETPPEGE